MDYNVKLPEFEGPFDLLYQLIEKEKIDLNNFPLSKITNDYLEMIKVMTSLDIHVAAEFLVMAATLLRLKSQMILPRADEVDKYLNPHMQQGGSDGLDIPDAEEGMPFYFESQEDMVNKLKEYKIYKEMANKLRECEAYNNKVYYKTVEIETKPSLSFDDLTLDNLAAAFQNALKNIRPEKFQRIVIEKISLEDKIEEVLRHIIENQKTTFPKLLELAETKFEMVMTFLAVLELMKSQKISVKQKESFGEIEVKIYPEKKQRVAVSAA